MPLGLAFSIASAVFGAYMLNRQLHRHARPTAFLILVIVFLITIASRELDAPFWEAVFRR